MKERGASPYFNPPERETSMLIEWHGYNDAGLKVTHHLDLADCESFVEAIAAALCLFHDDDIADIFCSEADMAALKAYFE